MCEQMHHCIIFGEGLKVRGKNSHKIFLKSCTKSSKMAIRLPKFSKNFRAAFSPCTPLELFLFLTLPRSNSAGKDVKMWSLSTPLKNSEYAPYTKHFQRVYLRPFPGLNV